MVRFDFETFSGYFLNSDEGTFGADTSLRFGFSQKICKTFKIEKDVQPNFEFRIYQVAWKDDHPNDDIQEDPAKKDVSFT